jgi:trimethylamine---corrinoid protein Co-methyltransferase
VPQYRLHTTALDEDGCAAVHGATLDLLDGTGVEVQHDEALAMLAAAGARVQGTRAHIPAGLVDDALAAAPRSITLASRGRAPALQLTDGPVYYGTGSDCIFVHGPGARDRRQGVLADVEEMAALQEKLPNLDYVLSMVHPHELAAQVAPVAQFAAMLRGTSKPLIMVPEDARHLAVFKEMAAACGAADSWAIYAMPTPPLQHGKESVDRLAGCARLGIPMVYASAFLPGATAPASAAGCVLLANAEMLSGLVISQLAAPGAPFVYGTSQGWMEPRLGHIVYCGPEEMAVQQASADMARHYGLPSFGTGGCSDSLLLDEQWAFQTGMTLLTAAQSGVTLLHDIGYLASGTGSSYESMVVADELVAWVKAYLGGVTIDEEALAVAEIAAAGPGGTHLGRKYSRRHLRDFFRPNLIGQDSFDAWQAAGAPSLLERAQARTRELVGGARAYRPSDDAVRELARLVAGAA